MYKSDPIIEAIFDEKEIEKWDRIADNFSNHSFKLICCILHKNK